MALISVFGSFDHPDHPDGGRAQRPPHQFDPGRGLNKLSGLWYWLGGWKPLSRRRNFPRLVGVTRGRVSQWMDQEARSTATRSSGSASPSVLHVEAAQRQLGRRLDLDQRITKGRSRRDGADTLGAIQRQRLAQLELANAHAREAALARAGLYVEADDARQEMGRVAGRLLAPSTAACPTRRPHSPQPRNAAAGRAARASDGMAGDGARLARRGHGVEAVAVS